MTLELSLAIGGLFVSVGLITGLGASNLLARTSPERRRLHAMAVGNGGQGILLDQIRLTDDLTPRMKTVAARLPKSPKEMGRLRRRLASAGIYSFRAAVVYTVLELGLPVLFAGVALTQMRGPSSWLMAVIMATVG